MKVLKDSLIYVLGEIISKGLPFLLLPYLTRSLGTSGFGELAFYLSIIAFANIFISLSHSGSLARYYYVYGNHGMGLILLSGYLYSLIVFVPLMSYALMTQQTLLMFSFTIALLQSLLQTQLSYRQCRKKALDYFKLQVGFSTLNIVFTILLFEVSQADKVLDRLMAICAANALVLIYAFSASFHELLSKVQISLNRITLSLKYIIFFGVPLLFHSLSYTLKGQLDRLLIFDYFDASELGIYVAGVQIASILSVVIMAANSALVPYLYEKLKNGVIQLKQIHELFFLSFLLIPLPSFFIWLLPESIFLLVLGEDFLESVYYTIIFLFASALVIPYLILVNFLFYHGKNTQIALCSVISTLIYIISLFFLKDYGITFVPFASIIGNIVILPMLYIFSIKIEQVKTK